LKLRGASSETFEILTEYKGNDRTNYEVIEATNIVDVVNVHKFEARELFITKGLSGKSQIRDDDVVYVMNHMLR